MSLKTKIASTLLSLTVLAGVLGGTVAQSEAKKLSKGEVAAIAGVGGVLLGLGIANANRGPDYYGYSNSWDAHVQRCFARYRSYNPYTDTYVGYDGYERRCRL